MTDFLMITLVIALMVMSPGPDFAVVVKNSLTFGRSSGLYAALGIALACLCHVAINLLGIGVIISQSMVLFNLMKILGATYLIYLGYKGLGAKKILGQDLKPISMEVKKDQAGFYSGFITCMMNPKACLFFLSFFSVILSPNIKIHTQVFYGVWVSLLAMVWFSLVALFFTSPILGKVLQANKHWLERITGGVLILLGLKLLSSEINT